VIKEIQVLRVQLVRKVQQEPKVQQVPKALLDLRVPKEQ
jgi:hypothetical protein